MLFLDIILVFYAFYLYFFLFFDKKIYIIFFFLRVEALQEEMTDSARNYAKEIANLKMIIAEKQALLDTLHYD